VYLGQGIQTVTPGATSVGTTQMNYPLGNFQSTGITDNASATAVTVNSSGNVGIGMSGQTYRFQIAYSGGADQLATFRDSSTYTSNGGVVIVNRYNNTTDICGIKFSSQTATAGYITFHTGGTTEAMRIDNSGNVLVGTTNNNLYAQNTVNGLGLFPGTSPTIQIANDPNGSTGNACLLLNFRNNPVNGAKYIRFFYNGTSDIGNITLNGTTAVSYNTSSDYRLKENVVYNLNGIERIKLLKPARFNFIVEPNKIIDGFLAHEVQSVVPEAITGIKDEIDKDGKPVYQGIDQSKLVPLLTGALQEAIAKIESLQADIAALKTKVGI
jgi:hypothetical protein